MKDLITLAAAKAYTDKKVEQGGGSGGAKSWNDLEDKPFGDEVVSLGDTITWDGTDGGTSLSLGTFLVNHVVSDYFSADELKTGEIVWSANGQDETILLADTKVADYGDGFIVLTDNTGSKFYVMAVPQDDYSMMGQLTFPKKGLYLCNDTSTNAYVKSVRIPNKEFHKETTVQIAPKYIPNYENVLHVTANIDAENVCTVDKTYTELLTWVLSKGKLALTVNTAISVNGVMAQGQQCTENYSWAHASGAGVIAGEFVFSLPYTRNDGVITANMLIIGYGDEVEMISTPLASAT